MTFNKDIQILNSIKTSLRKSVLLDVSERDGNHIIVNYKEEGKDELYSVTVREFKLEIECPRCAGSGINKDGHGDYSYSKGQCPDCKGKCFVKNKCRICNKQIIHDEGSLCCSIKCQMKHIMELTNYKL